MVCATLALGALIAQSDSDFDFAYREASKKTPSSTRIVSVFKQDQLAEGSEPAQSDHRFVFGIDRKVVAKQSAMVKLVLSGKTFPLKRVGKSTTYVAAKTFEDRFADRYEYVFDGKSYRSGEVESYKFPPELKVQPGVPQGKLIDKGWISSKAYPGTTRQLWIYVPSQYDASKPAALTIVLDGQWNRWYWPIIMDNMIAAKEVPVTIVACITPGKIQQEWDNRSIEFDTVSDRFPNFLIHEIIPMVESEYSIRKDPKGRTVMGASSAGIASFNCTWMRPDQFHKAISLIGSYTNLQGGPTGVAGGNTYPAMIRDRRGWDQKGEPKPIRVFLQAGKNDLDNKAGNWPVANLDMAAALKYGAYDFGFDMGNGFHSDKHGRSIMPSILRWLWRDEPQK